jgi:hypothetical protein
MQVCSHGMPPVCPPARVVRREGSLKRVGLIALLYYYLLHVSIYLVFVV